VTPRLTARLIFFSRISSSSQYAPGAPAGLPNPQNPHRFLQMLEIWMFWFRTYVTVSPTRASRTSSAAATTFQISLSFTFRRRGLQLPSDDSVSRILKESSDMCHLVSLPFFSFFFRACPSPFLPLSIFSYRSHAVMRPKVVSLPRRY
jgi:hypothetical protein